ncbi:MAG: Na(+)/H(+) antiporter subunit D [Xanthomonadales bacterium]|nr:Na(+)/H(+) antiporter subunit D [Xanthomonadales bacterium]
MIWTAELPPFVPFYIAAILVAVTRGWLRGAICLAVPVLGGLHLAGVAPGTGFEASLFGMTLEPYRVDRLSLLFGYLFHIAAFLALLFALHVRDTLQQVTSILYAGSALGAVFAGDLLTLFIFWEMLAITSVFMVWCRRTTRATWSGFRYLMVQVLSGVLLLAGALLYYRDTGSQSFGESGLGRLGGWTIFIAFGIKCGFPLLHNWLTDAYPEGTATGTVFLASFTTKAAVYAMARGFPGTELLVYIGAVMACFPIFYAVIENDLRRVLAYSMINQIGFMMCGIGIGTALALNGAVAHAFNDVIFKGLLMMSMGAVLHQTGRINGSDLGGLYKSMPITATLCIVGAASISAFPLFSGFVSKSLIMSALAKEGYHAIWLAMLFAAAGVFHHAGIKIPYFAFFAHDSGIRTREPPWNMLLAMGIGAALCILIGSYPTVLYQLLPYDYAYWPYDATHVLTQTQLLFFSAMAFVWLQLQGIYPPELPSTNLDADWTYRRAMPATARWVVRHGGALDRRLRGYALTGLQKLSRQLSQRLGHGPSQAAIRSSGTTVLWVGVLLALFLVFYAL